MSWVVALFHDIIALLFDDICASDNDTENIYQELKKENESDCLNFLIYSVEVLGIKHDMMRKMSLLPFPSILINQNFLC